MSEVSQEPLNSLPHGPEFRFIDRLTELDPGKRGAAEYLVRGDEAFLKGHFPGAPIFPGVLLVESIAQLAGTVAQTDPAIPALNSLKLTAMRSVKITGTAGPGTCLEIRTEITGRMGTLVQASGSVSADGNQLAVADVVLAGE